MNPLVRRTAVLALMMFPSFAFAQEAQKVIVDNKVTYGLGAGVSVPTGDAADALDRGVAAHGFARFLLSDSPFIPRVDVEYQKLDLNSDFVGVGGSAQVIAATVNVQLFIGGATSFRPYVVGGIGAYHLKFETDAGTLTPATSESSTRFGLNGGGGIAFRVNPRLSIYGEIRLDNILNDEGAVDSDLQLVPFTFGITF